MNAPYRLELSPPATRGDCADLPRPCSRSRCRYHLERGPYGCALDHAEDGPHSWVEIADLIGYSGKQSAEMAASNAMKRLARNPAVAKLREP